MPRLIARDILAGTLRRRTATFTGAILLGLAALGFAFVSDEIQHHFSRFAERFPYLPFVLTPLGFVALVWLTRRLAPEARSSGIPQVIAAVAVPDIGARRLVSLPTALYKLVLTVAALGVGASVGREGPTVQVSAAIMTQVHRYFRVPLSGAVVVAGGAAGVSAAFNTPLAGVAFALEELAAAYEQRMTLLVMAAVMISGMVSLGIAGDYIYFGQVHESMSALSALYAVPLAGVAGGVAGALFSRVVLLFTVGEAQWLKPVRQHPLFWAGGCGVIVALVGWGSGGLTWGTGYEPAKALLEGQPVDRWFGLSKLVATLATTLSGLPGGIFAPSLSVGAGLGQMLAVLFPSSPPGTVALIGMTAYFVGVVRAPLTSVIIISEMTGSRAMVLPLLATAVLAEGVAALVCRERLYHGLARPFRQQIESQTAKMREPPAKPRDDVH